MRVYRFEEGPNTIHVLYSRWEDKAVEQSFGTEGVSAAQPAAERVDRARRAEANG